MIAVRSALRLLGVRSVTLLGVLVLAMSGVSLGRNQNELLVIVQNDKYGYIDHTGKIVIPAQFIWAEDFWRGLGTVYVCGRYLSINSSGTLLPLRIAVQGHLEIRREGKKVGFVDSQGRFKIRPKFDDALPFSGGFAAVQIGDKWGFIDAAGRQVIKPQFKAAYYFREGVATAESESGSVLINPSGKVLASGYQFLQLISDGRVPASRDGKAGYLDLGGKVVIPFQYEETDSFSSGLAAVKKEGKWGFIDRNGQTVIPFKLDEAGPYASGLAPARIGSSTGFIDKSGRFSFQMAYRQAPGFLTGDKASGLFIEGTDVSRFWTNDDKFGYVNTSGRIVWGPTAGSPDHPPLTGWSEEENARSCEGISESMKATMAGYSSR